MAQTKRKRQTKHRGNAAGVVVARGRTGRKPTAAEKSTSARKDADSRTKRTERLDQPPSWRGAIIRAFFAALVVLAASLFLLKASAKQSIGFFPVVLLIYIPLSYYTDLWLFRRRQKRKQRERRRP